MTSPDFNSNLKTLIQENPLIFNAIHSFNKYPAAYIHKSWIRSEYPWELFQKLIKTDIGMKRLSQMILKDYHLEDDFCYNPVHFEDRFVLMPPSDLMELMLLCGIVINYRTLQTIIDNSTLCRIKKSIGSEKYVFGVKRAPLIAGRVETVCGPWCDQTDFKAFAQKSGAVYFLNQMSHLPRSVIKRLLFKFPRNIVNEAKINEPENMPEKSLSLLKRIIITEIPQF